jgi:hypothetical protein
MFFTSLGRVYRLKAYKIPEASRNSRGTAIVNLLNLLPEEKITAIIPIMDENEDKNNLFMATRSGIVKKTPLGHVNLTPDYGLEFLVIFLALVDLAYIIVKLLYAHHVAVVGEGNALHAVGNGLVDEFLDGCLAIENRVLRMNVQVDKILHGVLILIC